MLKRLQDHVAIVTGADSGIGQAIAVAFAREGADLLIVVHSDKDGAHATADLVCSEGRTTLVRQADLRDQRQVTEALADAANELGAPDILVNSAGVGAGNTPVAETTGDDWDRVLRTDLYAPFYCCRHFIQARKAAGGGGRIINITSVHEAIPSPNAAAYGAAKGGLLTLTRSLALEVAKDRMTVNAIAPGMIKTPMTAGRVEDPEKLRQAEAHIPLGWAANPRRLPNLQSIWRAGRPLM